MPTRNVVITDHQESFIGDLVDSGRYKNASEVLRESLRLLERRELHANTKLELLRRKLDEAETDIGNDRLSDYTPCLLDEIDAEEQDEYRQSSVE